ncbi:MAG: NAD(P)/FAD-dependent oxidoreductase [bacterium]
MTTHHEHVIVGAGFAGLAMGEGLLRRGRRDFVILEKAATLGGTWRDNTYPGAACDVPAHLYSLSAVPNPDWSRTYAPQPEILAYMERCADALGLRPHLRYGARVLAADWDDAADHWRLRLADGEITARHLILGAGGLHTPAVPPLPGLEDFRGPRFHTAEWDHGVSLEGKRVAVIGTGASAIQVVPAIAPLVGQLDLYQRTPPWIVPRNDRPFTRWRRRLFAAVPPLHRLYRWLIYLHLELRGLGFTTAPRIMPIVARIGRRHIRRQLSDPALRAAVTPSYVPGCKRVLISDDYYPALARDNVALVTDAIEAIETDGIRAADGTFRPADVIVLATGFDPFDLLDRLPLRGPGGRSLAEAWQARPEAWLGTMTHGFPNLYFLVGPNTGLGHSSMVFMIEAQVDLVLAVLDRAGDARRVEVSAAAQARYNEALRPRLDGRVWASGCRSWYLDAEGRNVTLWPGSTTEFWARTRRPRRGDLVTDRGIAGGGGER